MLTHLGKFKLDLAKFYAAEIVSALEYMKKKGIVHRDLKVDYSVNCSQKI